MSSSEAVTRGIRVQVRAGFSPAHSQPHQSRWFFLYTITITNESDVAVQLLTRHWIITDASAEVHEVRGPGVVGKQPVLEPGRSFEYTSGCPLATPYGSMKGTYRMVTAGGEAFDAEIGEFVLRAPFTVH
jgi:ApaG protein